MTGWTKLFSSIVTSSVWCEPHATVRVWVAMLATKDADGVVEGSIPGFANLARVTIDEMRAAVATLSAPDPDSRTPDHQGRRIEVISGGWKILNHAAYRERGQAKEGSRAPYMRAYRARKRTDDVTADVTRNSSALRVTQIQRTDTEAEAEAEKEQRTCDAAPPVAGGRARKPSKASSNVNGLTVTATDNGWSGNWVGKLVDLWSPHGAIKPGRLGTALKGLKALHPFEDVERGLSAFLKAGKASFGPEVFAQAAGDWIAGRSGPERKETLGDRMVSETTKFLTEGRR